MREESQIGSLDNVNDDVFGMWMGEWASKSIFQLQLFPLEI